MPAFTSRARADEVLIDTWAALNHKSPLNPRVATGPTWVAPSWTGVHARRLAAYKVLAAYLSNTARSFIALDPRATDADREKHREFGDAAVLRNAIVGTLMGDEQTIVVDGADEDLPEAPDELPPETPGVDTPPELAGATAIEQERQRILDARDRQEWLRDWAGRVHLVRKVFETERNAVGIGDGVYVLGWSTRSKRATLRVYDPGFYFPVLSTNDDDEFPSTVHLAWEEQEERDGTTTTWVRRVTYRLAPIEPKRSKPGVITRVFSPSGTFDTETPPNNSELDASGNWVRSYEWNDEPSAWTCYLTDAKWKLEDVDNRRVADFDEGKAVYVTNEDGDELRDLDIELDFIPVVHVPNTVAESEHFGQSALLNVAQILDELAAADTDLASASATTGTPMIGMIGGLIGQGTAYRPGAMFNLPAGGRLDVVDTSTALDALLKYVEQLLRRLSTNARVPASVLGRIDPAEIASGVLLALSFGPLKQLVTEMRLVRDEKYPLLLKFAQRLAVAHGELPDVLSAELQFGSFLPTDRAEAVKLVRQLLGNGTEPAAISRMTALRLLVDAGFELGDAMDELERIESEDFRGASLLLAATGDELQVFDYLGRAPSPGALAARPTTQPPTPGVPQGTPPTQPGQPGDAPQQFTPTLPGGPPPAAPTA